MDEPRPDGESSQGDQTRTSPPTDASRDLNVPIHRLGDFEILR